MPSAVPIPIIATPTVPAVPQDVPVATEMTQQNKKVNGKKNFGVIISIPPTRMDGIVPAAINAAIIIPTAKIIAEEGIHFFADSYAKSSISLNLNPKGIAKTPASSHDTNNRIAKSILNSA